MPPVLKHPDDLPIAAERVALVQWLTSRGVTGTDRTALVRAGDSRRQIGGRIKDWARERPKAKG